VDGPNPGSSDPNPPPGAAGSPNDSGAPLPTTVVAPAVKQDASEQVEKPPAGVRGIPFRIRRTLYRARLSLALLGMSLTVAAALFFAMGAAHFYNISFVIATLPQGLGPTETALEFTTLTFLLGMVGAIGLGLVRAYPPRKLRLRSKVWRWPLYGFASGYVAAIRGTPFLVQMYIVLYLMLFTFPTVTLGSWDVYYVSGFMALLINTTGYQTEAFRGGFQSVEAGQTEAGKAVGLRRIQVFLWITLPQSLRLITLPLANEWISNFKTVTILQAITIVEVFFWTRNDIAGLMGRNLEAFVLLTLIYLMVNVTVSRVITYVEKVRRIPGLGTPTPDVALPKRLFGISKKTP